MFSNGDLRGNVRGGRADGWKILGFCAVLQTDLLCKLPARLSQDAFTFTLQTHHSVMLAHQLDYNQMLEVNSGEIISEVNDGPASMSQIGNHFSFLCIHVLEVCCIILLKFLIFVSRVPTRVTKKSYSGTQRFPGSVVLPLLSCIGVDQF